jgi:hypothetical protein
MEPAKVDLRERTKDFALSIMRMFSMIPKSTEAQVLGKQMLRSGTSVGANYREAYRGRSKAEWSERAANDIDGSAAQGSGSESGEERINLSRNVAILCASLKRPLTGYNCSSTERLSRRKSYRLFGRNATSSSPFL